MAKNKKVWKKVITTGAITTSLALGFWASKTAYTVREVIDGDTFITANNQAVRLDSVNAPENDYCLGQEAKDELARLVLNKKVFMKVTYLTKNRLVASVYTINGDVGKKMLEKGLATFTDKGNQKQTGLLKASQIARDNKIGVYSKLCTQSENTKNPKCNIMGNIGYKDKLYRYPGCKSYDNTLVQLHLGDKWFCTEKEAKDSGFAKGGDCL